MNRFVSVLLVICIVASLGSAEDTSFRRVRVPNLKGKLIKAVLTFSDNDKAVEVRPAKGDALTVPYPQIEKASYEFTESLSGRTHWLEIHYRDQDARKVVVLLMDKHDYIGILDALKAHTGIDVEVLGNTEKVRRRDLR